MLREVEWIIRETGLAAASHRVEEAQVHRALRDDYGLVGRLTRIDTEKDATFRLTTGSPGPGGERTFLVKISQPDEPLAIVECQVAAVEWIAGRDPGIPVQTLVPTRDGTPLRTFVDDSGRFAGLLRVHRFIPGTLLAADASTPARLQSVGAMLGNVDHALGDFAHSGEDRVFVWDLARFLQFEPLLELEPDAHRRALAQSVFTAYRERIQPQLSTARTQVIHGDFSPFNVVVDPDGPQYVTGVLDFGDVVRGPVVFDPAVLLGNHLRAAPEHPWTEARHLLDGYRESFPLTDDEVGLVAVASAARVALRALIAAWRLAQGTDRADYVTEHARDDWGRIENVVALGFDAAHAYLLHRADAAAIDPITA